MFIQRRRARRKVLLSAHFHTIRTPRRGRLLPLLPLLFSFHVSVGSEEAAEAEAEVSRS